MKRHSFLPLPLVAWLLLISILLQNCGGATNLPIEGEEEPTETIEQEEEEGSQGRRKRAKIEEVDSGLEIIEMQQEPLSEASNICHILPPEIWQEVFSHLDFKGILSARRVSSTWNELITGTPQISVVGVMNKAHHIIDTRGWVKDKEINFRSQKLNQSIPETIPSFAFYHLMGSVRNLSQSFWPYLQGTNVHTLDLSNNDIDNKGIIELVKVLPRTQIHTLDLGDNNIDDKDIIEVAKVLPYTQIHTLWLDYTEIGYKGVVELAKVLPQTQIHTLDLCYNNIGYAALTELTKVLPQTQIHSLYLSRNQISEKAKVWVC
ncbi:MAG: F-box protein [Candidatus Amoebophilus sp.]